ncbi:MAG: hypothetical protein V4677_01025 [Bacteroidota bacterium]
MKKIKGILLIAISFFAFTTFSQTNSTPAGNNAPSKEQALKESQKRQQKKSESSNSNSGASQSTQVQTISNSFQLDENDVYQGRKQEFLSQMIVKDIPSDFPKYEKWMGVRHYNEIVEEYYKKHLDILKERVREKLTRK